MVTELLGLAVFSNRALQYSIREANLAEMFCQ